MAPRPGCEPIEIVLERGAVFDRVAAFRDRIGGPSGLPGLQIGDDSFYQVRNRRYHGRGETGLGIEALTNDRPNQDVRRQQTECLRQMKRLRRAKVMRRSGTQCRLKARVRPFQSLDRPCGQRPLFFRFTPGKADRPQSIDQYERSAAIDGDVDPS